MMGNKISRKIAPKKEAFHAKLPDVSSVDFSILFVLNYAILLG